MRNNLRKHAKRILPPNLWNKFVKATRYPPVGSINFGSFRRVRPVSQVFGLDRGQPIDRYYIEKFLEKYPADVQGHTLEIGGNEYTHKFGGERVIKSDILHVSEEFANATIIADLTQADHLPSDTFDCIICTQTLHFIFDVKSAVKTLFRILKPGGVLLATVPGISQISRYDMDRWGEYWRFTRASIRRITGSVFPYDLIQIEVFGNVLAATAFLYGLAASELSTGEIDHYDRDYEVLIGIRAKKPGS